MEYNKYKHGHRTPNIEEDEFNVLTKQNSFVWLFVEDFDGIEQTYVEF